MGSGMMIMATFILLAEASAFQSGPKPLGNYLYWIIPDDYPLDAFNAGKEGTVEIEISVDEQGHAARCRIVRSSGTASLDQTACAAVARRGSWEPTRDEAGQSIFAIYRRRIVWALPGSNTKPKLPMFDMEIDVAKLPIPRDQASVTVRQIQRADGSEESCTVVSPSPSDALNRIACRVAAPLTKLDPIANANGDLVRGARWRRIQFSEKGEQKAAP